MSFKRGIFPLTLLTICLFISIISGFSISYADELEEISKQISDLQNKFSQMEAAKAGVEKSLLPLENELKSIENRIKNVSYSITLEEGKIAQLDVSISKREASLSAKYDVFSLRVRQFYIRKTYGSPIITFLMSGKATELTREFGYRRALENEDKRVITDIAQDITDLEKDKKSVQERKEKLVSDKIKLASAQKDLDTKAAPLRKVIKEAEAYQSSLSSQISALSAKQQALLAEKTGTFATSVGDVPLADDPNSRPDYNPGFSPAFAAFSFGAPHRKGMSQYGAYGRAKSSQSAEDILKAYYGDIKIETRDTGGTISTAVGDLSFEENYLMGIAEMPSNWGDNGGQEALKAQAIAARSYAMVHGKPICIDEGCQVYSSSKASNTPDTWKRAVNDTRGKVVVSNSSNQVISTWYASTAGGYTFGYSSNGHSTPGVWDTKCGSQGCWTGEAYEKISGSPWFYKGWYKTRGGATCGRSSPWLKEDEFADILNAVIVSKADGDAAKHIFPVDVNSCFGRSEDVWDANRMRDEANKHGGAITSVGSVSVSYSTGGMTASLKFNTNRGEITFSGDEFKTIFNLRAPGRINLQSSLFNIEKK